MKKQIYWSTKELCLISILFLLLGMSLEYKFYIKENDIIQTYAIQPTILGNNQNDKLNNLSFFDNLNGIYFENNISTECGHYEPSDMSIFVNKDCPEFSEIIIHELKHHYCQLHSKNQEYCENFYFNKKNESTYNNLTFFNECIHQGCFIDNPLINITEI